MGTHVQIEIDEENYEKLKEVKDKHGVTWYGMLRSGGLHLENCQQELSENPVTISDD